MGDEQQHFPGITSVLDFSALPKGTLITAMVNGLFDEKAFTYDLPRAINKGIKQAGFTLGVNLVSGLLHVLSYHVLLENGLTLERVESLTVAYLEGTVSTIGIRDDEIKQTLSRYIQNTLECLPRLGLFCWEDDRCHIPVPALSAYLVACACTDALKGEGRQLVKDAHRTLVQRLDEPAWMKAACAVAWLQEMATEYLFWLLWQNRLSPSVWENRLPAMPDTPTERQTVLTDFMSQLDLTPDEQKEWALYVATQKVVKFAMSTNEVMIDRAFRPHLEASLWQPY